MVNFKLGTNFDFVLLDKIDELNKEFRDTNKQINEVYGSERRMAYLTARPDFRLPDINKSTLESFIKKCKDINVAFNYTFNSIFPGSKQELDTKNNEIKDFVKYLENIGVKRITIASPLLMEITREASSTIGIEVSTVAHICTVSQIKTFKENYNIEKVCGNLLKNRSIKFLENAANWCNTNDVIYELMVNEFCGTGGKDYLTMCHMRAECYIFHSTNHTKEDALLFNNYPMD